METIYRMVIFNEVPKFEALKMIDLIIRNVNMPNHPVFKTV